MQSIQLINLIENIQIQNLRNFLEREHPSREVLDQGLIYLVKNYQKDKQAFYELLNLLLKYGASPNISIIYHYDSFNIDQNENVTLLMLGIKMNDLTLIDLVLNYNPDIEKTDSYGRNAIVYSVIYDHNDSPNILNILIRNKASIDYSLNMQMLDNHYEYQSVFTLAIFKDLKNITKCLLDNKVDINFRTAPRGDTGLHIAAQYSKIKLMEMLLNYQHMIFFLDVKNNEGKTPIELVQENDPEKIEKINLLQKYKLLLNNIKMNTNLNNSHLNKMNPQNHINRIPDFNNNNINNINNNKNMNKNNFPKFEQHNNSINNAQINMKNMNNGKKIGLNNSPGMNYNYNPFGINMNMGNGQFKNNQFLDNYGINNNLQNKNIGNNNYFSSESNEDRSIENDDNINFGQDSPLKMINNNISNYPNQKSNKEEEKTVNKQKEQNIIINKEELLIANPNNKKMTNNNKRNIAFINQYQLSKIKSHLYNKIWGDNMNFNFEIPIEFINHKRQGNNLKLHNMNNFIKQNDIPVLNLDLSDKLLSKELILNSLKEEMQELKRKQAYLNVSHNEISQKIKQIEEKKNSRQKEKYYILSKIEDNKNEINKLKEEQKNIINSFPSDKLGQNHNKQISYSKYINLKFDNSNFDENYIIRTLHKELIDYQKYIAYLMNQRKAKIDNILQTLSVSIKEFLPEYQLKVYGAYAQELCLPWSDLDIVLVNKNKSIINMIDENISEIETTIGEKSAKSNILNNINQKNDPQSILNESNKDSEILVNLYNNKLKNSLSISFEPELKQKDYITYLYLKNTNDDFGRITITISIDSPHHYCLKELELVKSFIKEYPPLRPLILALEGILYKSKLNGQYKGGLSSYGLILMVVSFIQSQKDTYTNIMNEENIFGKMFYEFLKYYGTQFDFDKYVIITYKVSEINSTLNDKENQYNIGQNQNNNELSICDPLDKKRNIGKSTFQFKNIRMAFLISFMVTKEECECGCHYGKAIFENDYNSTEHCYLKRMFNSVNRYNDDTK